MSYETVGTAGLFEARSDDLKGFHILGTTLDELHAEGPIVAKALVREMFGVDCDYRWVGVKGARLAKQPAYAELVCQ